MVQELQICLEKSQLTPPSCQTQPESPLMELLFDSRRQGEECNSLDDLEEYVSEWEPVEVDKYLHEMFLELQLFLEKARLTPPPSQTHPEPPLTELFFHSRSQGEEWKSLDDLEEFVNAWELVEVRSTILVQQCLGALLGGSTWLIVPAGNVIKRVVDGGKVCNFLVLLANS